MLGTLLGKALPGQKQAEAAFARWMEQMVTDPFALQLGGLWLKATLTAARHAQQGLALWPALWPGMDAGAAVGSAELDAMRARLLDLETRLASAEADAKNARGDIA